MKFRTKILMMPLTAGIVFVLGTLISVWVGSSASTALKQMREVDVPYQSQLQRVDRNVELFQLTLQRAAVEGDISALDEVTPIVQKAKESVAQIGKLDGKATVAGQIEAAFDAYQTPALAATRAMLQQQDPADNVAKMQSSLTAYQDLIKRLTEEANTLVHASDAQASSSVSLGIWVSIGTGVAVLLALGMASTFVVRSVWRDLGEEPETLKSMLMEVAAGNLEVRVARSGSDTGSMNATLAEMVDRLRGTVQQIRSAVDAINTASVEIESGNHDLSTRTESAASSLEETAASLESLTDGIRQNAEATQRANQMASSTAQLARDGGAIVNDVMQSMTDINGASRRIEEIISVIDSIAFQTNILALNAAVEAARAGEQGRGFAVVAGEVRTLAQRSAQAAKEISALIVSSGEKVKSGSVLVDRAGAAMTKIVDGVNNLTTIIADISASTHEQSEGVGQVNSAVGHLDQMTQQNAAMVEEAAAAATGLREQSHILSSAVSTFRVGGTGTTDGYSSDNRGGGASYAALPAPGRG